MTETPVDDPDELAPPPIDIRVQHAINWMADKLHQKLSRRTLAEKAGLSLHRFAHLFTAEMDVSPARYLKERRLEAARALLEISALSVKEITEVVGLLDVSHFTRDFKDRYGLSPRQYRARYRRAYFAKKKPAARPRQAV